MSSQLQFLLRRTEGLSIDETLQVLALRFPGAVTFSTSFSDEDQAITHLIARGRFPISLFTLDTGRLFQATHEVWQSTIAALGVTIKAFHPDPQLLEKYSGDHGPNAFYRSVALRKDCCHIRKVLPLQRALKGMSVWITGLRAEHSPHRNDIPQLEWDEQNGVIKYHPLLYWTTEQVAAYVQQHRLPVNALGARGFVSIGCEPCTRAIRPGEDFRAGRWWWEEQDKKECGLHVTTSAASHHTQH